MAKIQTTKFYCGHSVLQIYNLGLTVFVTLL